MILRTMRTPQAADWLGFAELVATAIPNYLVSQLGPRFGAVYYRHLAAHPDACCLAAYDETGTLAGCILGTLDRSATRRLTLPVIARLLLAANIRLLSPAFLGWLARGVGRTLQAKTIRRQFPAAELAIIAVAPEFRGEGLALQLIDEMETFFRERGLRKPYLILTEKENLGSNRFYEKIGAKLIRTYRHHGREINEWHKALA